MALWAFWMATCLLFAPTDWLIDGSAYTAAANRSEDRDSLVLENGLIRRTFRLAPNLACVSFENIKRDQQLLRAIHPEAELVLNGQKVSVGGLVGQKNHAFLTSEWIGELENDPQAFKLSNYSVGDISERLEWKRVRHTAPDVQWPPRGVHLKLDFEHPTDWSGITVSIHYELYDGVPGLSKWLTIQNDSDKPLEVSAEHLVYVAGHDQPVPASVLKQGMHLVTADGQNNRIIKIGDITTNLKRLTIIQGFLAFNLALYIIPKSVCFFVNRKLSDQQTVFNRHFAHISSFKMKW